MNPSILKATVANTNTITRKIKAYPLSILLAVVIATAFFIHMAVPPASEELEEANVEWDIARSENTKALNALKQLNFDLNQGKITSKEFLEKQPKLVEEYTKINKEKDELYNTISEIKSEAKFLHFKSFQYFLGEIGWAFGLFLYALANLFAVFRLKTSYGRQEFTGKIVLHSTLLFIGCFYTFYVFYAKDDFAQAWYILAMILCTFSLVMAGRLIADSRIKKAEVLRKSLEIEFEAKKKVIEDMEERIFRTFEEKLKKSNNL